MDGTIKYINFSYLLYNPNIKEHETDNLSAFCDLYEATFLLQSSHLTKDD